MTVTVTLVGVGASPDHPVTDLEGTFNYAIDQGHRHILGHFRGPADDPPTPVGSRGDRSGMARHSDQERLAPVPLADELADVQLAPLAKLGGAGIAEV